MSFPNRLADVRSRRGWTQTALAQRSGVPRSSISAIEIGRLVPSVETALVLARTLSVPVETVFGAAADAAPGPELAWTTPMPASRVWSARVGEREWRFPVEATAAGVLPPDEHLTEAGYERVTNRIGTDRTLVIAGCDPSVTLLANALSERGPIRVLPLLRSSQDALELLRAGRVHAAGLHLSDARGRAANARLVREKLGRGYTLLHQMRWQEGVAVAASARSRSVDQLLRKGRWVNREPGAAARACFDRLLDSLPKPAGYHHTVRSHHAVAATVSSGWADAGICVRPVAHDAGLDFLPVQEADYELCLPNALLGDPVVTALIDAVRSTHYRQWLSAMPGCHTTRTGDIHTIGRA